MPGKIRLFPIPGSLTYVAIFLLVGPCGDAAGGDDVYKCINGSEITYQSSPDSPNCRRIDLQIPEPSPEERARLAQEQQQREQDKQLADQKNQRERLVRAQELEAAASMRRARAEETQAQLLREQQQRAAFPYTYYSYPYWGYEAWPPYRTSHHRRWEQPPGATPRPVEPRPQSGGTPRAGFRIRIR